MTLTAAAPPQKYRIASIDILRGAIMIFMALDHVRDFFHANTPDPTDLSTTNLPLFLTRFITHFCAPIFIFLSGISAFLSGQRKTKEELSAFLIKRGIWLVLLEVTVVTLGWTFDPAYHIFVFQVIQTIGWSMIVLGLLIRISPSLIFPVGLILVLGHNFVDLVHPPLKGVAWTMLLTSPPAFIPLSQTRGIFDLYAILPWMGLMLLGYSAGRWYTKDFPAERRRKILLTLGLGLLIAFVVMRYFNTYGDPNPWSVQKTPTLTLISFLNVTKYPVSLIYELMTIGVALVVLALTENAKGPIVRVISVYGRVPFFYYIIHLYLIHFCTVILFFATGHNIGQAFNGRTFGFRPGDMGFSLGGVYLVWIGIVFLLYFPCRWYNQYKRTHGEWYLSYL
jgi:uncharacterized membrane protein